VWAALRGGERWLQAGRQAVCQSAGELFGFSGTFRYAASGRLAIQSHVVAITMPLWNGALPLASV